MKANSFPRSLRLLHKSEFLRLKAASKKWVGRHWVLFYARNDLPHARIAVTISGRYGNSVERNRFRRWMREAFRTNQNRFAGWDLHFIAKQKPVHVEKNRYKDELHEDFQRLLDRLS